MSNLTKQDVAIEAIEISKPFEKQQKGVLKEIWGNIATIISLSVICLFIVLFAYNTGFCDVFNLPVEVMPLDIKNYIELAVQCMGMTVWVVYSIAYKNTDKILNKNRYNVLCVLYGCVFILRLLNNYHFYNILGTIWCIVIAIAIPAIVEFVMFFSRKQPKNKTISSAEKELEKETNIFYRQIYNVFIKNGLFVFVIIILLAPIIGEISAKANMEYQTFEHENQTYVIIVEYSDSFLVQKADIEKNHLTIYTNNYLYLSKENRLLSYDEFKEITIKKE